jgi:hypothetical protein
MLKFIGWIGAKIAAHKAAGKAAKDAANDEIEAENKKGLAKTGSMLKDIGAWFAKGPWGWVIALASIAAIIALGVHLTNVAVDKKKGEKERKEEEERNKKTIQD